MTGTVGNEALHKQECLSVAIVKRSLGSLKIGFVFGLAVAMLFIGLISVPQIVSADAVVGEIDEREPRAAAVNPITNEIYVISYAGNENFKIIDGVTNQSKFVAQLSGWPLDVAVNPKTNKIYVTSYLGSISDQDIVTVIDRNNQQTRSIWTGKNPTAIAVNPVLNKIFVTSREGNSVSIIDGETNEVASTVDLGCVPRAIAVNPQTNKVYITCSGDVVKIINGETGNLHKSVSVGEYPEAIAIDHAANRVYIAISGGVSVINGDTDAIKATIPYNDYFTGITVNPITHKIYAAGLSSRHVLIIDGERATIEHTVSVQSKQKNVVVNSVTNKIYVTTIDGVTVIDGDTNNSLGTLTVDIGEGDVPLVVNPITNKIYAGSMNQVKVFVIDGSSTDISRIGTGNNPRSVAINPFTQKAYIANAGSREVTIVDLKSKQLNIVKTLNVGEGSIAAAVNPLTNRIYVVQDSAPSFVSVIDGNDDTIVTTVPVGGSPSAIAVNPITNQIYVANNQSSSVTVIDGASNSKSTVPVGSGPIHVAVHPLTNKVYVTNSQDGTVSVIDGATKKVTATVPVGQSPKMATVNEKTNQIYVANSGSNNVTIIDGASNATNTVPVGNQPYAIAVNKKTNKVFVTNFLGRTVTVIDGASLSLTHLPTSFDDYPQKLAVDEGNNKIYIAALNSIMVIDGVTNTLTKLANAGNASDITVNPATNQIYATETNNQLMTITQSKSANPLPVQIAPFPNNRLTEGAASVRFTPKNNYAPIQGRILDVYYQLDSTQGAWKKATPSGSDDWIGSLDGMTTGMHVLFALATDGQEMKMGSGIGGVYAFYVAPKAAAPIANPAGGAVAFGTRISLSTSTEGASIYYTTNGDTPTSGSMLYTGPIEVTSAMTLKAIAVKAGMTDSEVMTEQYTVLQPEQVAKPIADPAGGAVAPGTKVTLTTATEGAKIYYFVDPFPFPNEYTGPITVNANMTIRAYAKKSGMADSEYLNVQYTIALPPQAAAPTANPPGGAVAPGTLVTLETTTDGATIYYTLDGSTPTSSSAVYSGPIEVASALTLRAIAVKSGMTDSAMLEEHYTMLTAGLTAPAILTGVAADRQATMYWSAVPEADSYSLYRYEGEAAPADPGHWQLVEQGITSTRRTVTGLTNDTSYVFAVKSVNAADSSNFSAAIVVKPSKRQLPFAGFDQNQGRGGYQLGRYDMDAQQPTAFNWTRQTAYPAINQPIEQWAYQTGGKIVSAPVIAADGTIYVGSYDGKLHAI